MLNFFFFFIHFSTGPKSDIKNHIVEDGMELFGLSAYECTLLIVSVPVISSRSRGTAS